MVYKGYEILVECNTEKAVFEVNGNGEIGVWYDSIDSELEPVFYGIMINDNFIDWIDYSEGLGKVKEYIDNDIKESGKK